MRNSWLVLFGCSMGACVLHTGASAEQRPAAGTQEAQIPAAPPAGGGSASPTPVDVHPVKAAGSCANLAAVGVWEKVTPPGDLGDAIGISVDPFATGGLFVGMHKGGNGGHALTDGLYKSSDCGATWSAQLNTGANGDAAAQGSWTSLVVDPIQRDTIYVAPIYGAGGVWKTTDGGVDWAQLFSDTNDYDKMVAGNFFDNIAIDPNHHLHLIAGTHADCLGDVAPACLAETTDGGDHWAFHKLPIPKWGENAGPWIVDETSWFYAGGGILMTTDSGATFAPDSAPADAPYYSGGEEQIHPMPRDKNGAYYLASAEGVVQSTDGAHTWSLLGGSPAPTFGLTIGGDHLFSVYKNVYTASISAPTSWSVLPHPADLDPDEVCFYGDYDEAFHVLYISCYGGGVWRTVTE